MNRRLFLAALCFSAGAMICVGAPGCGGHRLPDRTLLDDVSRLNPTYVSKLVEPDQVEQLREAIRYARKKGLKVSISGARHSQGGHAFHDDALVLDMTSFNKILNLDQKNKILRVQSGATWAQIQAHINPHGLALKTMQSSNIFTVGGSMSSNIHGRDPNASIIIDVIRSFRLLNPDGKIVNVSRTENAELFCLVIGGYGLFGVILDVDLELTDNVVYEKEVAIIDYKAFPKLFEEQLRNNSDVGLFIARPSIAPSSLLRETVVTTWKKAKHWTGPDTATDKLFALQGERNVFRDRFVFGLSRNSDWGKEKRWKWQKKYVARTGKKELVTRNNAMRPPTTPLEFLKYNSKEDTDIVQEYFIPTGRYVEFMDGARTIFKAEGVNLLGVTIRYVAKNEEAFLSYALADCFSIMCYTNQKLSGEGLERARRMTRRLVDLALANNGTYYLTYQLFPTQRQIRRAYPNIDAFFARKRHYDKEGIFMNKFYRNYALK